MTTCVQCAAEQPEGARFCNSCGSPMALPVCVSCGTDLVPGARFCNECGAAQDATAAAPAPAVTQPVAARRVTSVLFGDLVGFTSLSEHRDQEETRELLTRYFDECRRVIERYGGVVEKFIGDAVMAVWGVPAAHEDDAERSVRAGLELVNAVTVMGDDLGLDGLAMRVGIVTGEVAVTVGAREQGMVAGDAVNTASRVQSAAAPGQVWVDETTRLLTSSAITYVDVGSHELKGKTDPMPLWAVRAVVAARGGAQRADGLEAPLVGRDRELRLVKELFHATEESGRPALVIVDGEAGVGKSRLAWEFEKYVDGLTRNVRWHSGRCLSYGEGVAYSALADAFRARLGLALASDDAITDDDEPDPEELLGAGLAAYVSDPEERDWIRPRLAALLGAGAGGTFAREDLFQAWATFLERVSGDETVVLVINDAQYADDGLVQFVEHLLANASFPCFLVLMTRPGLLDEHPALATNRRATVLHLPTLSEADMSALVGGLVAGLPDDVLERLVQRAEGVPLFAVETVRSLIDRDLVVPRGGQYVLADPDTLDLSTVGAPASLQALVAARLDTLTAQQRRVVDHGSVLGNSFTREEIARLCPEITDLDDVLAELVRLQVLRREASRFSAELGQFQFVQSVVRQVAYASLSRRDRKAIHLAVADDLAARDDAAGELAAVIAQHYMEALDAVPDDADVHGLAAATVAQLRRAAARAAALGSPKEAAAHLRQALSRSHEPLDTATIEAELAAALRDSGDYALGIEHAIRARDRFVEAGDRLQAGSAAATLARCLIGTQQVAEGLEAALPWYEELSDEPGAARVALALSEAVYGAQMRMSTDIREVCDRRVRLAELLGDEAAIADSYSSLAVYYSTTGAISLGRVLLESSAARARAAHNPIILGRALTNLAAGFNGEDASRAVAFGREAVEVVRTQGSSFISSVAAVNLVLAHWSAGNWDDLEELARQGSFEEGERRVTTIVRQHVARARGEDWSAPADPDMEFNDESARLWFEVGNAATAAVTLAPGAVERAVHAAQRYHAIAGLYDDFVFLWQLAVEVATAYDDGEALAQLARIVDEHVGSRPGAGVRAHRSALAAELSLRAGAPASEVEEHLREAIAGYERWGSPPYTARARARLGRLLVDTGSAEEGAALLGEADATFERLGASAWRRALVPVR
jgi:class 3 adenylate cyclase